MLSVSPGFLDGIAKAVDRVCFKDVAGFQVCDWSIGRSVSVFQLAGLQFVADNLAFLRALSERSSGQQQHSQDSFHRQDPRGDFTAKDAKGAKAEEIGSRLLIYSCVL
jgi:hypothetical protein